jgi:CheY-like chemotaxis protein
MSAIDTCLSGAEALELVKKRQYDIVFMDHMMPGMDGIETTTAIRALGGSFLDLPIVALTANAVSGMREMFLEKGFSDYLSKPIELTRLDEVMAKWIPRGKRAAAGAEEKPPQKNAGIDSSGESEKSGKTETLSGAAPGLKSPHSPPRIDGVDASRGIALTGGTLSGYEQVLAMFRKDAETRLPVFASPPEEDALLNFITQVHALKRAAASIGAAKLSSQAAALEAAGREKDIKTIRENLPAFAENLRLLAVNIRLALGESSAAGLPPAEGSPEAPASRENEKLKPLLRELIQALEKQKTETLDRILAELESKPLSRAGKEALEKISGDILKADYDAAK